MNESAPPPAPTYTTHAGDAERDREVILAIWRGNIGRADRIGQKFDWFYRTCPWGVPHVVLLRHEPSGAWVGVAAVGPRRMLFEGREIRAGVLVDMAVHPDHRSLGPALMLQRAVLAAAAKRFDLVYGFPNPKAAPVFVRVGYVKLGESIRYVRVLHFRDYLARRVPRWIAGPIGALLDFAQGVRLGRFAWSRRRPAIEWTEHVDPRFDAVWAKSDPGRGPVAPHDCALLGWRFDQAPSNRFRYLIVRDDGPLPAGWFACESDGAVLHVRAFWWRGQHPELARDAVAALCREASKAGHASVSVEFLGPPQRFEGWRASGFIERGGRPVMGKCLAPAMGAEADLSLQVTQVDEDE